MIRSWRRHRHHRHIAPAEMNITAFMNLMVILVPFLLITAVFSRLAVLELVLPTGETDAAAPEPPPVEVTVRSGRIELAGGAAPQVLPNRDGGYDVDALSQALKRAKARAPEETAATILLEPDIPYEVLVRIMDAVRATPVLRAGAVVQAELFPDISIGDAPAAGGPREGVPSR